MNPVPVTTSELVGGSNEGEGRQAARDGAAPAGIEPLRLVQVHIKTGELVEADPFVYDRCIQSTFPVDGRPQPVSPGVTIDYTFPDMYGGPWSRIRKQLFEKGMTRPERDSVFAF